MYVQVFIGAAAVYNCYTHAAKIGIPNICIQLFCMTEIGMLHYAFISMYAFYMFNCCIFYNWKDNTHVFTDDFFSHFTLAPPSPPTHPHPHPHPPTHTYLLQTYLCLAQHKHTPINKLLD